MIFIQRKILFGLIGLVSSIYFILPFIDEYFFSLNGFLMDHYVFLLTAMPYYTLQLVVGDLFVIIVFQLIICLISWIGCYFVLNTILNKLNRS